MCEVSMWVWHYHAYYTHSIRVNKGLISLEDQPFVFSQHENILDSFLQSLPRPQEETLLSFNKLLLTELWFPIRTNRVYNHTVLSVTEGRDIDNPNNLLPKHKSQSAIISSKLTWM